jgi:hypothetical protein
MKAVLGLILALGVATLSACGGGGLQQTPLPAVGPQQPSEETPITNASPGEADAGDATPDQGQGSAPKGPSLAQNLAPPKSPSNNVAQTQPASTQHGSTQPAERYVCRHPASPGRRECDAIVRVRARNAACNRTAPYCAFDLQAAYGVAQVAKSNGKGSKVAVVAAYGYPNASGDLAIYRKKMGLPACSISIGCLKLVNQRGRLTPLPKPNADASDDWRPEEALDLDMISAICPNCKLVLVQTNTNKATDLAAGVNAAAALGAVAISNSYSGGEESAGDSAYAHSGRAITASSGDDGTGAKQPCSFAGVVCVGGTTLLATSTGRGWSERAWRYAGSGCSQYVSKPSWQRLPGCAMRAETDISAIADPATGVAFYASSGGWQQAGGTSVSAAIVAAMFALGPSAARTNAPQWIWRHRGGSTYHDIILGDNGDCSISYLCHARQGYDGPTGWGTPAQIAGF